VNRLEENVSSAEVKLPPDAVKAIRTLTDNAEIAGTRNRTLAWIARGVAGDCIPLDQWKGERVDEVVGQR